MQGATGGLAPPPPPTGFAPLVAQAADGPVAGIVGQGDQGTGIARHVKVQQSVVAGGSLSQKAAIAVVDAHGGADHRAAIADGGASTVLTSESTSQDDGEVDEETGTSGAAPLTVKSTPKSLKTPGFEVVFAVIGLVIVALIIRRDNT